jgi:hypothetical protein
MDPRLQNLIDRSEILDLLSANAAGNDRMDGPRTADTYHLDSWEDHGPIKGPAREFVDRSMEHGRASRETPFHLLGQSTIELDGDRASAETYFFAVVRGGDRESTHIDQIAGRYLDRFERRAGRWRIAERTCVCEWTASIRSDGDWLAGVPFVESRQAPHDLSYAVLGLTYDPS